jgi:Cu2+-exporting ATPase
VTDFAASIAPFARRGADGRMTLHAMVEGVRCGGCVAKIERALLAHPSVVGARINLSTRRLALSWNGGAALADAMAAKLAGLGFVLRPFDPTRLSAGESAAEKALLRALAVAGFAAANVMLLSVAIWAGHVEGMEGATRDLLHWFSALIALPALVYAARPFLRSALAALKRRTLNMDVPIAVGIVLTAAMSVHETMRGAEHAYFDSAITLVFFLLLGRYFDLRARGRARAAAERLLALTVRTVTVLGPDGTARPVAAAEVVPGTIVLVAVGERIGVDGTIVQGSSHVDASIVSGESVPAAAKPGGRVFAGSVNLEAPLQVRAAAAGEATLLAEIARLMEQAEQRKSAYVALADRASRLYAPAVHLLALLTFLFWWGAMGADWRMALVDAIAVLIITCPCALGLAVPAVQVIATGRLMRRGILLKSATALERLAVVDSVVFDKTGTLTLGRPKLMANPAIDAETLQLAAGMARNSTHPLARALIRAALDAAHCAGVREEPGAGLTLATGEGEIRLGSRAWCGIAEDAAGNDDGLELWLVRPRRTPLRFRFEDELRTDAAETIAALKRRGYRLALLSGDRPTAVAAAAAALGIDDWYARCTPADKTRALEELAAAGRRVLMVGDGLNDAPALAAALVSASPANAADFSQTAADAVFQGDRLDAVVELLDTAAAARRLVRQNLAAAIGYNALAVPVAIVGWLTPFLAAIAMSTSSLAVVGNALRLARGGKRWKSSPI